MKSRNDDPNSPPRYQSGFGNEFSTESLPDSLPLHQNNPLLAPRNLYAEQISGTAFTAPRASNSRTWMYRIRPSASGTSNGFVDTKKFFGGADLERDTIADPNPLRWNPAPPDKKGANFMEGATLFASSGHPRDKSGLGIYLYAFDKNMSEDDVHFRNSDGDFLIVPQMGGLRIKTELGVLEVAVGEICVIPRGIVFSVDLMKGSGEGRGYLLEVFRGHFELPELGPIGANGLANPRDFLYPTASHDPPSPSPHTILNKFQQTIFSRRSPHSPHNVVSWHGNYAPYKYDLDHFCTMNSVSYDHPDPSIYTVLTVRSGEIGTALADFVIFPPRWCVAEKTFRPPYFHRNCMTEFMGMIRGSYDAKKGFRPGGASLHGCMTPHGPDSSTFHHMSRPAAADGPEKFQGGMAFMFETYLMLRVNKKVLNADWRDWGYAECWDGLEGNRFEEKG